MRATRASLSRNPAPFVNHRPSAQLESPADNILALVHVFSNLIGRAFYGPLVELKLVVKETGKLTGEFVIRMGLQIEAARELAATLTKLADAAEAIGRVP